MIAFITGASSGFGKAMAEIFAKGGYSLILTGRRADRLNTLKADLEKQFSVNVKLLVYDIRDREAGFKAINSLEDEWKNIDLLINNAGLAAGRDLFEDASLDDWETMVDTNIKGVMYTTKAIAPFMIEKKSGHIINIGSIAGWESYERGNGYCATKAAVIALSESMRVDFLKHNIRVTCINPGAVETEFSLIRFKGDAEKAAKIYEGYTPLSAEDIAGVTYYCASLPANVCINDLTITPIAQANSYNVHRK
jgi:short-subunit dehydrogenase